MDTEVKGTKKRRPVDELEGEQRLTKRFDLLNLERNSKLYIPVSAAGNATSTKQPHDASNDSEFMDVEDTKHKVYIFDLDKELAESESDEDRPIFLADIEKHLVKIPKSVLIGDDARKAAQSMQMVLYDVPTSLTVPKDKDNVRRAIIEARQRARDGQASTVSDAPDSSVPPTSVNGKGRELSEPGTMEKEDPDAMDMD